jgi:hypothetical protein
MIAQVPSGRGRRIGLDVERANRAERLYRSGATARGIAAVLHVSPSAVLAALRTRDVLIRPVGRRGRSSHKTA